VPSHAVAKQSCILAMANSPARGCAGVATDQHGPAQPLNEPPAAGRVGSPAVVPLCRFASLFILTLLVAASGADATGSYYTDAQAQAGQTLFHAQCAICHGETLEGKVGPALAGATFLSVSQYQKLNADYLFRFMSKHMPANAPGSLSQAQYLDSLAYILKVNGYPAGQQPLTADDQQLAQIKIEPTGTTQQSTR